jgi:hypothetical protein
VKKKTKQHLLLLEPEQKEEWKKKASLAGMTLNKYIRSCVERRQTIPIKPAINIKVVAELSRIGNNLNQQTKAIHTALKSGENPLNWQENLKTVEEVANLLRQIQAELMGLSVRDREDYKG